MQVSPTDLRKLFSGNVPPEPPRFVGEVLIYSQDTQQTELVFSYDPAVSGVDTYWLGTGSIVLIQERNLKTDETILHTAQYASSRKSLNVGALPSTPFRGSPVRAEGYICVGDSGFVIDSTLKFGRKLPGLSEGTWTHDGTKLFDVARTIVEPTALGVRASLKIQYQVLDTKTGTLTSMSRADFVRINPDPEEVAKPMEELSEPARVSTGKESWGAGFLTSGENRVLVSGDATMVSLSPDASGVAYISRGSVLVRPIVAIDLAMYRAMKESAERAMIISNAKQCALALIIHAADNDDNMLGAGSKWEDKVFPYIKNRDVLAGFVLAFKGGNITDVDDPSGTVLGYIPGKGGRAVAYLDGHVKWVSN